MSHSGSLGRDVRIAMGDRAPARPKTPPVGAPSSAGPQPGKEHAMLTETPLADAVLAGLDLDPRIPDSLEIAVDADGGTITLRGTVESFRQRRAAADDAYMVEGVYDV